MSEQKCRVCGCDDNHACQGGCWWVEKDLCSRCAAAGVPAFVEGRPLPQPILRMNAKKKNEPLNLEYAEDYELYGYKVRDLIVAIELMRKCDVQPEDLHDYVEAFLKGYKIAAHEIGGQMHKVFYQFLEAVPPTKKLTDDTGMVGTTKRGEESVNPALFSSLQIKTIEADADQLMAFCVTDVDPRSESRYGELKRGALYPVQRVDMGQWSTTVTINGSDYNSVMFEFYIGGKPVDIYRDARWNPYMAADKPGFVKGRSAPDQPAL